MSSRRAVIIAILGVAVMLLVASFVWRAGDSGSNVPPGPTTGLSVILVGIDGFDWFIVGNLLEQGELPTLARILRSGPAGGVAPSRPVVPEVGWTELARGRALSEAERALVETGDGAGLFAIVPDLARIVAEEGGTALSVGWPASWPAGETTAEIVAAYSPSAEPHAASLAPALFAGAPRQASTEALTARVERAVRDNVESYVDEFSATILADDRPIEREWVDHIVAARWGFLADLVTLDVAASLIAEKQPDLSLVYFGGLDAVGHRFLAPAASSLMDDPPESYTRYEDVLTNYYSFMDDALARFLRLADDHTILIVCSTYGTHPTLDVQNFSGSHQNGSPGVLVVRGADLVRRAASFDLTPVDFAPTILEYLGLPIPAELDGRVVIEMLPKGHLESFPPNVVPMRMRDHEPTRPTGVEVMDELAAERLRMIREDLTD
jgi:hypothetical protein